MPTGLMNRETAGDNAHRIGAIRLPIRRLHVELTNRCNFSCEFCPDRHMSRPRGNMPLPLVEKILREAGAAGIAREVHFHIMGDPLLYPDLAEAIQIGGRSGLDTWVTTNGSLLTPHLVRVLGRAGLTRLTISLQTPNAETFGLRGSHGFAFEQYRDRLIAAVQVALQDGGPARTSVCFLSNPLRRFRAPNPPQMRVGESTAGLRSDMERWGEWLLEGTAEAGSLPRLRKQVRRIGILRETRLPLTGRLDFQVRALGNWAGHFAGPIAPARFGYCQGLTENLGVLWNGEYVICCTDYDGRTAMANASELALREYLLLPAVQDIVRGFQRLRVRHPYCRQCLGDSSLASALCRQVGSILYFKVYRPYMQARSAEPVP